MILGAGSMSLGGHLTTGGMWEEPSGPRRRSRPLCDGVPPSRPRSAFNEPAAHPVPAGEVAGTYTRVIPDPVEATWSGPSHTTVCVSPSVPPPKDGGAEHPESASARARTSSATKPTRMPPVRAAGVGVSAIGAPLLGSDLRSRADRRAVLTTVRRHP